MSDNLKMKCRSENVSLGTSEILDRTMKQNAHRAATLTLNSPYVQPQQLKFIPTMFIVDSKLFGILKTWKKLQPNLFCPRVFSLARWYVHIKVNIFRNLNSNRKQNEHKIIQMKYCKHTHTHTHTHPYKYMYTYTIVYLCIFYPWYMLGGWIYRREKTNTKLRRWNDIQKKLRTAGTGRRRWNMAETQPSTKHSQARQQTQHTLNGMTERKKGKDKGGRSAQGTRH